MTTSTILTGGAVATPRRLRVFQRMLLVTLSLVCFGVVHGGARAEAEMLTPQAAFDAVAHGAFILDVRTPEEFAAGALPGSILIPYDEIEARVAEIRVERDRPIIVYCASGRRAGKAVATLHALGFTDVSNAGGYDELKEYWDLHPSPEVKK